MYNKFFLSTKAQKLAIFKNRQVFFEYPKCIRKYVTFPDICMTFEIHTLDYQIAVGLRLFIISTFSQAYALIR